MSKGRLDAFLARKMFDYDPKTGILTWVWHPFPCMRGRVVGKEAGCVNKKTGYRAVLFQRRYYLVHRMAYLIQVGHWPFDHIDHINGVKTDNRWSNLRPCTRSQNGSNRRSMQKNNTTGARGVTFHKRYGKYQAQVMHNKRTYFAGRFATIEEAQEARDTLAKRLHGDFFVSISAN